MCTAVISDIGSGFGENPMFHFGKQQFSPENDSPRPRASTHMGQGNFATKGIPWNSGLQYRDFYTDDFRFLI